MKQNKNTTGIWRSTLCFAMLLLTLALASCADESLLPDRNGKGETSFTLELIPPGAFSIPQTRSLAGTQDKIDTAVVLIYDKDDHMVSIFHFDGVKDKRLDVEFRSSYDEDDIFDILVIGNPPRFLTVNDYTKNRAKLQKELIIAHPQHSMMMWGEVTDVMIHSVSNTLQIKMLRALARVDIGFGVYTESSKSWGGLDNFKFSKLTVENANDRFLAIPDAVNLKGSSVIAPSVPLDAKKTIQEYSQEGAKYLTSEIYIPETEAKDRVKLIVEGWYNGSTTTSYYRVDMCLPNPITPGSYVDMDILRNHLYRISITAIKGDGYSTYDEALNASALNNIAANITTIAGWSGDIIFDAHSSIATDVSEVQVYGNPAGKSLFTVTAHFEQGVTARVTGPGSNTLTSDVPLSIMGVAGTPHGDHTYVIEVGKLKKEIKYRVQPAVDAHFDFLPFKDVASMTIKNPKSWITLSSNMVWKAAEQQSVHLEGNGSMAYAHFDENLEQRDSIPRTAEVLIQRNTNQTLTRVHFDQSNITGMICANFGGNLKETINGQNRFFEYEKHLAIESLEEYAFRIYDGDPYKEPTKPSVVLPSVPITGPVMGIRMGDFANRLELESGTGREDNGISITFAHAGVQEDGVSPFGLTIYNNYPFRYCFDKNRDINGNGKIDVDEVLWYVPTRAQLASLYLLRSALRTELPPLPDMEFAYWSIYIEPFNKDNKRLGVMNLTTGLIGVENRYRPIRCVRDISK